ncbi:MAG TPA: hypothetical protein VKF35_09080 [Hyphomicrobiaceae bacterium]|nr:hypothetical protein [Hyphomicrobiaceae bacterium]
MYRIGAVALAAWTAAIGISDAALAREATSGEWVRYKNERFGFSLEYPTDLFRLERTSQAGDGRVFVARNGEARLLVGALSNSDRHSAKSYQDFLARTSYAGFKIGYRPLGDDWLVLSGDSQGKTFYEKAIFTCGGRLISSFAMIYPTAQRATFDPMVARVANSFVPGRPCGEERARNEPRAPHTMVASQPREEPSSAGDALANRIAREQGHDVIVIMRRTAPPYDYKYVRGYANR